MTSRVLTGRSVRGMRLPPAIGFEERRELERVLVKTLLKLDGDLKGDYYPLRGSKSYRPKPNGMTQAMEEELRSCGNLFKEPDSNADRLGKSEVQLTNIFIEGVAQMIKWEQMLEKGKTIDKLLPA